MNKLLVRILDIISNDAFPDEDKPYIIKEVIDTYNDNSKLCYPAGSRVELGWGDGYDCGYNQAKHDIGTSQQREPDERYRKGYKDGTDATVIRCNMLSEPIRKVAYDKGFEAGKRSACDLQQRELDAKWDAGYLKGVSDAEAKLTARHAAEMKVEHDRAFSLGKNAGYEERKKHVQVNQDHFYNRGHAEGYQKGLDEKAMRYVTDIFTVRKTSKEEGYQEGYKAGRNEVVSAVVNTINNLKHTTGGIPK